jgi:ABC-2 type transport system permease protein
VWGKVFFALLFGQVVMCALLLAGGILGWYAWPIDIPYVLLHTLALNLAAAGVMVLVFVVTRTEKQAGILSWIVIMLMSVLGGSMFPVENMPATMAHLSHFTITYHGVEGYLDLLVRGRGVSGVWANTAWLAGFGLLTLLLGQTWLVRRVQESAR